MNDMNFDEIEFAENADSRCSVIFILDCSDSMETIFPGEARSALEALNGGLDILVSEIHKDPLSRRRVELSFVPYGTQVADPTPFTTIDNIVLPELSPMGITNTGAALTKALDALDERKEIYKKNSINYFQSMAFLISDGLSMDSLDEASKRIKDLEDKRKLSFFAIGVEGADLEQLSKIGKRSALGLKGLKFEELFAWVSASTASVSASTPDLVESEGVKISPPTSDWASI